MSETETVGRGIGDLRLTRAQEQIWIGQRLHPNSPMANMALVSWFDERLDVARFVAAVHDTVMAHEALRTVYVTASSTANGVIGHSSLLPVPPRRTEIVSVSAEDIDSWTANRVAIPLPIDQTSYDSVLLDCEGRHGWYMNIHHLSTDATSSALVFATTAAIYAGRPPVASSHRAYVEQIADARTTKRWQSAKDHWQKLAIETTVPTLYRTALSRQPRSTRVRLEQSAADRHRLAKHLEGELKSLSSELALTAVLTAAIGIFRHRVAACDRTVIGIPIHNRGRATQHVVGCCIELFPLVLDITPAESFRSVCKRALTGILRLLGHAQLGTSPAQQFDVVVNVSSASLGSFGSIGAKTRWIHSGAIDPNHALRVQAFDWDGSGEIEIEFDVNHAVASPAQRARVGRHIGAVVRALVHDLDASIGDFPLITEDERLLIDRYNETGPGAEPVCTVVDDLRRVLSTVESAVLCEGPRALTGVEVLDHVRRISAWLASQGIGRGDLVGIHMRATADAVLAIYAVLDAGAAFVPLDPDYPATRQDHIAADAGLTLILDTLPPLDAMQNLSRSNGESDNRSGPTLEDVAYVIYTSGSTGLPKGVPITHRGLQEYLTFATAAYASAENPPVVPLFSSLSFDLTITSLFLPVLSGGMIRCHPVGGLVALREIVDESRATLLKATPSHLELLVKMIDSTHPLRTLIIGGEALSRTLVEGLRDVLDRDLRIFNEYGPTEAVVGCMIHQYDAGADVGPQVPIGRPAPGVKLFVLDAYGHDAPLGVDGELNLYRPGMTSGYLNRPELNAERFRRVPGVADVVLYRTGDRVRLIEASTTVRKHSAEMIFLGRIDDQMKIQGVRLEPGEVEAALLEHQGVIQIAVRPWRAATAAIPHRHCVRCGVPSNAPGVSYGADGVCATCRDFDSLRAQANEYFRSKEDLVTEISAARNRSSSAYDVLHLISGGKDSTYALYQLVAAGARVRAMTLDNGFISEAAKDNARRAAADLAIPHEFVTTPAMNEIFRDSLERFSNVCNGCYKALYTLAIQKADELGIPLISTGLSRGQLFETRLTPGQFALDRFDPTAIDAAVLAARKVYHRTDDAVSRLLDVSVFDDDSIFERVRFLDFYRYVDVELHEILDFLDRHTAWVRPTDTGRSTNCLINVAGISVHRSERGFHNYAVPYAWDVRLGHKSRREAIDELDDEIDEKEVSRLLATVGYEPRRNELLTAWYVAHGDVNPDDLRSRAVQSLPAHSVPAAFVRVDAIPLTTNGKVDTTKLPAPLLRGTHSASGYVAPSSALEQTLSSIWGSVLGLDAIGVEDDFFVLGGTSLRALEMIVWVSEHFRLVVSEVTAFEHRTIRALSSEIERLMIAEIAGLSDAEVAAQLDQTRE